VGFFGDQHAWDREAAVRSDNYSWLIPTMGNNSGAYYKEYVESGLDLSTEKCRFFPNWSSPGVWNQANGIGRPGQWPFHAGKWPFIDKGGMTPCYTDGGRPGDGSPFSRFSNGVGHGAPRTRTVEVAPVGVQYDPQNFSPRVSR